MMGIPELTMIGGSAPHIELSSTIHISPIFEDVIVWDIMSTTQGQYCYMYD